MITTKKRKSKKFLENTQVGKKYVTVWYKTTRYLCGTKNKLRKNNKLYFLALTIDSLL